MTEKLIDLVLGELSESEAEALRKRIAADPELRREYGELTEVFSVMGRGEVVEPAPEGRSRLMAEAHRLSRPSLRERLAATGSLVRFRLQHSLAFRVIAASLLIHFLAMGLLWRFEINKRNERRTTICQIREEDPKPHAPPAEFVTALAHRRLPHSVRLRLYGIEGQEDLIRDQLETLLDLQVEDGSFGDLAQTGKAALALLAQGDSSALDTPRGRAIAAAMRFIMNQVRGGAVHGHALAALVEDYTLSYRWMSHEERGDYVRLIRTLIRNVGGDEAAQEGLALARLAAFELIGGQAQELGVAGYLVKGNRLPLLDRPANRLSATAVLARGHTIAQRERVRAWARPLFLEARDVLGGEDPAEALLTLQAPYRL